MNCKLLTIATLLLLASNWSFPIDVNGQENDSTAKTVAASYEVALETFHELIKERKWDEAGQVLDQLASESKDESSIQALNVELAMKSAFAQPKQAEERLTKAVDFLCNKDELSQKESIQLSSATSSLVSLLTRTGKNELAAKIVRQTVDAAKRVSSPHLQSVRSLELQLSKALYNENKVEEGWNSLEQVYQASIKDLEAGEIKGGEFVSQLLSTTSLYRNKKKESIESLLLTAEAFFSKRLEGKRASIDDLTALSSLLSSKVSANIYSNPQLGKTYLDLLSSSIERFEAANEALSDQVNRMKSSLKSLEVRLGESLARLELIGTDAPDFEPQDFVGMEPASLSELRGKVVLLDFWAIWCGPCIATFPHLREWQEKFGPRGFVILGMTKNYSYKWDEKNSRPVKAEEVSNEEELAMLVSFRQHHNLKHGFVVTPAKSEYAKKLMVSGIPQAVLLDKQGKIRMIKVGSQESNAMELEAEIEKLLAN